VAISAHDEAGVHEAVRRRGIERFLAKPFLGSTLVRTLNELMPAG
jgi:CheY-like chemotaxis protein